MAGRRKHVPLHLLGTMTIGTLAITGLGSYQIGGLAQLGFAGFFLQGRDH